MSNELDRFGERPTPPDGRPKAAGHLRAARSGQKAQLRSSDEPASPQGDRSFAGAAHRPDAVRARDEVGLSVGAPARCEDVQVSPSTGRGEVSAS